MPISRLVLDAVSMVKSTSKTEVVMAMLKLKMYGIQTHARMHARTHAHTHTHTHTYIHLCVNYNQFDIMTRKESMIKKQHMRNSTNSRW